MRRGVYLALAAVFVGLGVLGAFLPGLPTTPFLLLTSYFLMRSSPALNERLLRSRTFGPILNDWYRHRGVRRRVKWVSMAMALAVVAGSIFLADLGPVMLAVIVSAAALGLVVVARLPVIREE